MIARLLLLPTLLVLGWSEAYAQTVYVQVGSSGGGSSAAPFGSIQQGIAAASAGGTVIVRPGTYAERISTQRSGTSASPIKIVTEGERGSVIVTSGAGTVLQVSHANIEISGFVFDGQYGPYDLVKVSSAATNFLFKSSELRRTARDCIDLTGADNVVFDNLLIHRCLWWNNEREDAHGIVLGGGVQNFTVRNSEVHTFSGDALQVDPGRATSGWGPVVIEGCKFWEKPLDSAEAGFAQGMMPGENGIDTKNLGTAPRASLVVRNTTFSGFKAGPVSTGMSNLAALNLKENVDAIVSEVTVSGSEIGFRVRGPGSNGGAWVRIENAVVFGVQYAIRYEDNIENLRLVNNTFGRNISEFGKQAGATQSRAIESINNLFLGSVPAAFGSTTSVQANASWFEGAAADNYKLAVGSPAIDTGFPVMISVDRVGTPRPQGPAIDKGAFEYVPAASVPSAPIGLTVVNPQ